MGWGDFLRDLYDTGEEQAAGDVVESLAPVAGALSRDERDRAIDELRGTFPGPKGEKAKAGVLRAGLVQKEARKQAKRALKADLTDIPQTATSSVASGLEGTASAIDPEKQLSMLRGGLRALDYPFKKLVREPIASWATTPTKGAQIAKSSETFHKEMRARAAKGETIPSLVEEVKGVVGIPLAAAGRVFGAGGQAAADIIEHGPVGALRQPDAKEKLRKAWKEGAEGGEDLTFNILADPLSWTGMSNAAKSTMNVTSRLLTAAKVSEPVAAKALNATKSLMAREFTPETFGKVTTILERAGVPKAKVLSAFGQQGEFLGRGQLTVASQEILPKAGLPEFAIGKALQGAARLPQKGIDIGRKALAESRGDIAPAASRPLFQANQEGRFLKSNERIARAQHEMALAKLEKETQEIFGSAKGITKDRLQQIARFHLDPASARQFTDFTASMTPRERQFAGRLKTWFELNGQRLVKEGVLQPDQLTKNTFSGAYVPRAFLDKSSRSLAQTLFAEHARQAAGPSARGIPDPGIFKPRTADIPMGSKLARDAGVIMDPTDFVDSYTRAFAKGTAMKGAQTRMQGFLQSAPGVLSKEGAEHSLARTFDQLVEGGDVALRQTFGQAGTARRQAGDLALDTLQGAQSWWRQNVTARSPRYHIINAANDLQQMFYAGMNNHAKWLHASRRMMKGDPSFTLTINGQTLNGAQLKDLFQRNVPVGHNQRLELALSGGKKSAGAKSLEEAAGLRKTGLIQQNPLRTAKELVTGQIADRLPKSFPLNSKFAQEWEQTAKGALFLHELKKGAAPELAAETTFKFLLDYGDRGKALQVARWFVPFINWMTKAPGMAGAALLKAPGRVAAVEKMADVMGITPELEDPYYKMEKSRRPITLDPTRSPVAKAREALGAPPVEPGFELRLDPRTAFSEAVQWPVSLAAGPQEFLSQTAESSGFLPKTLYEGVSGKSALTGQPITMRDAIVPNLAPVGISGPMQVAYNRLLAEQMGGAAEGAPARPLGYSPTQMSPEEATAQDILSLLGLRTYEVQPGQRFQNIAEILEREARLPIQDQQQEKKKQRLRDKYGE